MEYYYKFSENEAFVHAEKYYSESLIGYLPRHHESRDVVKDVEETIFRPAMELQVAGLCLLAGTPRKEPHEAASFAFFIVDHLSMGWVAMLASHFRVAYTLTRSAVEASIFEVACKANYHKFSQLWNSPAGSGGRVVKQLKKYIPEPLYKSLCLSWDLSKSLGHASFIPVSSSGQIVKDTEGRKVKVMTFGGPYIAPLNVEVIKHLSFLYGLAAMNAARAMKHSLSAHFTYKTRWKKEYSRLMDTTKSIADKALAKLKTEE